MDRPHLLATLENLHGPPLRESRIGAWATSWIVRRPKISDRGERASPTGTPPTPADTTTTNVLGPNVIRPTGKRPSESKEKGRVHGEGLLTSRFT